VSRGRSLRRCLLGWRWFAVAICVAMPAGSYAQAAGSLGDLLYRESLFYARQQDYLTAISRLQLAENQELLSPSSADTRLLLARLKLAFGLHLDAGFDLHKVPGDQVSAKERNRLWYELAEAFYRRSYRQAAMESLDNIAGDIPADIAGNLQLLRASVLMSLNRDEEAAHSLAHWSGDPRLVGYARYNRAIALQRLGRDDEAAVALEKIIEMRATEEELLALRDRAGISLGYLLARNGSYERARRRLMAVRQQGPFSNQALLALGWIDYKQGRKESALDLWVELASRPSSDPSVLESLLVVPTVQREQNALVPAAADFAAAISAYTTELDKLQKSRTALESGSTVQQILQDDLRSTPIAGDGSGNLASFLGPLLVSRDFEETRQGHADLQALLRATEHDRQQVDLLAAVLKAPEQTIDLKRSLPPGVPPPPNESTDSRGSGESPDSATGQTGGSDNRPESDPQWMRGERSALASRTPVIPALPEVESPADRIVQPLPRSHHSNLPSPGILWRPDAGGYIREPPSPEITGLPSFELLKPLPRSGEFFRRPGQEDEQDYAYPDAVNRQFSSPAERYAYQLNRLVGSPSERQHFDSGAVPVGTALRDLADALEGTSQHVAEAAGSWEQAGGNPDLEKYIEALRERISRLRERIREALVLHESYARAAALEELQRRETLVQDLREHASLELAKTYDQSSQQ